MKLFNFLKRKKKAKEIESKTDEELLKEGFVKRQEFMIKKEHDDCYTIYGFNAKTEKYDRVRVK
mgnify:CR=1 FL=1